MPRTARPLFAAIVAVSLAVSGGLATAAFASTPATTVTVTPSTPIDPATETTLTVAGTGFGPTDVTAAVIESSAWTPGTVPPASTLVSMTVSAGDVVDGAFTAPLLIPAATLDAAKTYSVAVFAADDRSFDSLTALELAAPAATKGEDEGPAVQTAAEAVDTPSTASAVAAGNVTGGTTSWGLSTYLNSSNFGRVNPLDSAYVAPSTFNSTSRISTWANAVGSVNADGSAALGFAGTTTNFSVTAGSWLRFSDVEATLDTAGNGSVTAVVAYGTATGTYPNITYDASQAPTVPAARMSIVTLSGNATSPTRGTNTATWSGLVGSWSTDFLAYIGGSGTPANAWSFASAITTAGRTPLPFTFAVDLKPATTYNLGTAQWGLSTYLNSTNFGRVNPLVSAYLAPAALDSVSRISSWGAGSGAIQSDGTASVSYTGTSVNFSVTAGSWLKLTDLQATLDGSGNGAVSALVAYGTATGTYPNIAYDPAQAPTVPAQRLSIVTLAGNSIAPVLGSDSATWSGLAGSWSTDFLTYIGGSGTPANAWSFASAITTAGRTPLPFTFQLGIRPPAVTPAIGLSASPGSATVGTVTTLAATVTPTAAGSVQFRNGSTVLGDAAVSDGSAQLALGTLAEGSYEFGAYFTPTDPSAYNQAQSGAVSYTVSAPVAGQPGSLAWGVKESLRSYVLSGGGSITTSQGAGGSGTYRFPQGSDSFDHSAGTGSASYGGRVTFAYPAHGFSISLTNPRVQVTSGSGGTLVADVTYNGSTSSSVSFAALSFGSGSRTSSNGTTTFSNVSATLTAAGASAFQGFYSAGDALDPMTFVVGSQGASLPSTTTVTTTRTAAATPPATTGVTLPAGTTLTPGGEITITADGYQPGETGILVVIYSDPVVLATDAKADASGMVTWTGRLPDGLTGSHTITVQGSVNRGLVIDIPAKITTAAVGCPVSAATLTWGFKESFRSYISGTIANGKWTVANGATYTTPNFGWAAGTGVYDATTAKGLVEFVGSVNFTGHGGVLNTTVANPQLQFVDAKTAYLLLDVSGTTQDGATVDKKAVKFAELDPSKVTGMTSIPAKLTSEGSAAFGTYKAGDALDPVTVAFTQSADCAKVANSSDASSVTPSGPSLAWLWWVLGALVLAALVLAAVVIIRRRNAAV